MINTTKPARPLPPILTSNTIKITKLLRKLKMTSLIKNQVTMTSLAIQRQATMTTTTITTGSLATTSTLTIQMIITTIAKKIIWPFTFTLKVGSTRPS